MDAPLVAILERGRRAPVHYDLVFPQGAEGYPVCWRWRSRPAKIPEVEEAIFGGFSDGGRRSGRCSDPRWGKLADQLVLYDSWRCCAPFWQVLVLIIECGGDEIRRIREVAILETSSMSPDEDGRCLLSEFSILGAVGGLVGGILANVLAG